MRAGRRYEIDARVHKIRVLCLELDFIASSKIGTHIGYDDTCEPVTLQILFLSISTPGSGNWMSTFSRELYNTFKTSSCMLESKGHRLASGPLQALLSVHEGEPVMEGTC